MSDHGKTEGKRVGCSACRISNQDGKAETSRVEEGGSRPWGGRRSLVLMAKTSNGRIKNPGQDQCLRQEMRQQEDPWKEDQYPGRHPHQEGENQ